MPVLSPTNGICNNGQYALDYAPTTPSGTVLANAGICVACVAGTWNTCTDGSVKSCTWHVQTMNPTLASNNYQSVNDWERNVRFVNNDGITVLGTGVGLVGSCYPCTAAAGQSHFGKVLGVLTSDQQTRGYSPFYCQGQTNAPQNCPANMFALFGSDGVITGPCVCGDTWQPVVGTQDTCEVCDAGYYCTVDKGRRQCPTGQYSMAGWSACQTCVAICPGGSDVATLCDPKYPGTQTQNAFCVHCASCLDLGCIPGGVNGEACYPCASFYKGDINPTLN